MMEVTTGRERCTCGAEFEVLAAPYGEVDGPLKDWRDNHALGCSRMMRQCLRDWRSAHRDWSRKVSDGAWD